MSTLYVVATPIGNLGDITLRALEILKSADLIACEDTRHTRRLLDKYAIKTPVVSYHQHSRLTKVDWLIGELASGKDIALVSDAGTPGINDPGGSLVAAAQRQNLECRIQNVDPIHVVPIPGPNAGVALLSVSGLPADQYLFLGYLPKKKGRQTLLVWLSSQILTSKFQIPVVLYESPYRVKKLFDELIVHLPDAQLIIGRELTKQFEEIWRGSVADAALHWKERSIKGEFVLIVTK